MKLVKGIVVIVVIIIISLVAYSLLSKNDIGIVNTSFTGNSEKRKQEFIDYYSEEVRRLVFQKINNKENPICSGNCKETYNISNDDINFEVKDSGENFEVIYWGLENGKYKSLNVDDNDCSRIIDTTCDGNVLKNYISKKWMEKGE